MIERYITKELINEILYNVLSSYNELYEWQIKYNVDLQTKQTSEIFSKLLESICYNVLSEKNICEVKKASKDADVDISINDIPIEIKVTNGESWVGGEYSKRTSYYLLFSRQINSDDIMNSSFFVSLVYLHDYEWKSGGKNFYGTSYSKKDLMNNENKLILFGDIKQLISKNNKVKGIRLIYEPVNKPNNLH
jgi:hypothetical protein